MDTILQQILHLLVFYRHVSNQKKFWIISMQAPIYKHLLKISHVKETKYPISFTSSTYLSKSYHFFVLLGYIGG